MITAVKGTLEAIGPDWAVVSLGGVSLKVSVPSSALEALGSPGDRVSLFTHLQVRQDGVALFGFPTTEARDLFELLQGVSGVGPRQALSLLSVMTPETLVSAVSSGDIDMFERAPGVGKKTASRIVLELKGKLQGEWGLITETRQQGEVIEPRRPAPGPGPSRKMETYLWRSAFAWPSSTWERCEGANRFTSVTRAHEVSLEGI